MSPQSTLPPKVGTSFMGGAIDRILDDIYASIFGGEIERNAHFCRHLGHDRKIGTTETANSSAAFIGKG